MRSSVISEVLRPASPWVLARLTFVHEVEATVPSTLWLTFDGLHGVVSPEDRAPRVRNCGHFQILTAIGKPLRGPQDVFGNLVGVLCHPSWGILWHRSWRCVASQFALFGIRVGVLSVSQFASCDIIPFGALALCQLALCGIIAVGIVWNPSWRSVIIAVCLLWHYRIWCSCIIPVGVLCHPSWGILWHRS
jgi:hypothetical protein